MQTCTYGVSKHEETNKSFTVKQIFSLFLNGWEIRMWEQIELGGGGEEGESERGRVMGINT